MLIGPSLGDNLICNIAAAYHAHTGLKLGMTMKHAR